MNHEAARKLIVAAVADAFAASSLATKGLIAWPPLPFKRPANPPWHSVNFLPGTSEASALGVKDVRTPFVVIVQTFIAEDAPTGLSVAAEVAEIMAGLNGAVHRGPGVEAYFRVAGPPEAIPESAGFVPFNVTIRGYYDTHQAT